MRQEVCERFSLLGIDNWPGYPNQAGGQRRGGVLMMAHRLLSVLHPSQGRGVPREGRGGGLEYEGGGYE